MDQSTSFISTSLQIAMQIAQLELYNKATNDKGVVIEDRTSNTACATHLVHLDPRSLRHWG